MMSEDCASREMKMTNNMNVDPTGPARPSGHSPLTGNGDAESAIVAEKRAQRRRVLLGSAIGGGLFTLPNSPVLAQGIACSVSAVASQNGSRPLVAPCGNSPGCWKSSNQNGFKAWKYGAVFPSPGGVLVNPVHDTTFTGPNAYSPSLGFVAFNSSTPSTPGFIINHGGDPSTTTFAQMIDANSHFSISMKVGTTVFPVLDPGELANLIAGLLNQFFFGTLYSLGPTGASTAINQMFTAVLQLTSQTSINNEVNQFFGPTGSIFVANNKNTDLCPP
jgi:hypothetical protein